ncbi:MAG: hypothetical protein ACP5H2_03725 [Solirubrobacteraceae bacterium]
MRFLLTSFVGAGPVGSVIFGSLDKGPVFGVLAVSTGVMVVAVGPAPGASSTPAAVVDEDPQAATPTQMPVAVRAVIAAFSFIALGA